MLVCRSGKRVWVMLDLFDAPDAAPDRRPVLLGMNNPLSDDPSYALFPAPQSATGYRIFEMLQSTGAIQFRQEYIRGFDRRNVLDSVVWDAKQARQSGPRLWATLGGRTVCLLGREVVASVGLSAVEPLAWQQPDPYRTGQQPARWCYIPHPSGLNRWYNVEVHRVAVGLRLEQLYTESRS
jgi:hypothetical protein